MRSAGIAASLPQKGQISARRAGSAGAAMADDRLKMMQANLESMLGQLEDKAREVVAAQNEAASQRDLVNALTKKIDVSAPCSLVLWRRRLCPACFRVPAPRSRRHALRLQPIPPRPSCLAPQPGRPPTAPLPYALCMPVGEQAQQEAGEGDGASECGAGDAERRRSAD